MNLRESRSHRLYPLAVLVIGLVASIAVAWFVRQSTEASDRLRFDAAAESLRAAIVNWIDPHIALLRAGGAMFAANDTVSSRQFASFVRRLELPERYPGIQGIGFSLRIPNKRVDSLERAMHRAGDPTFRFRPGGQRNEYHAIIYLEPRDARNLAAIGYDMFSHETRREAMERARDSGSAAATGPVRLVQEIDSNIQPGFLIYEPVYRGGAIPSTVAERRERLLGFVYSPLRAGDLLRSVRRSEDHHDVDFQVFDGPEPITGSELHDSRTAAGRALEAEYVDTLQFPVAGRAWSMIVNSRGDFQRDSDPESWLLMLLGGLALTSMLYLLTRSESEARREAEETAHSLETSREALRLSEERFRKIFDQAPIGIAQTDLSDRLVLVNRRFCELLAHPPEELLGEDMRRFIHPDDQESSAALRRQVLDEGADAHLQKRYLRRDGSVVRAMTVLSLLRDAHGNPAHILAIVEDIGERLRVAEELFAAKEAAETANRAKDHFLAVLSHELRTPLTPVIAAVETFAHEDLPEDTRKLLSIIRRNISLEARLIDDLLDLTRIVNGKLTLHNEPVDAHRVIDDAIDMVEELRSSGVRVVRRYEAAQPTLIGDAARLQQVIWNLIRNAAKFTPFDGRIEISTRNVDSRLEITVTDNGIGIEPDVIPRIFNAFEQGEEGRARRHGGLGLGLTISRMLVEAHGGHISARSEGSGKGATFAVELPGAFDEAVPTPSTFRHGLRASGNGARLLLVDDHEDTRHVLELLLRQLGYEVITASSVRDALEKARGNGFDVIVSDIGLPDGDGYTLIRELRRDLSTPAIALSGYGMDEDVRRSREAGFDDHLTKPVDIRRLNDVILNLLDKDENGQN